MGITVCINNYYQYKIHVYLYFNNIDEIKVLISK